MSQKGTDGSPRVGDDTPVFHQVPNIWKVQQGIGPGRTPTASQSAGSRQELEVSCVNEKSPAPFLPLLTFQEMYGRHVTAQLLNIKF